MKLIAITRLDTPSQRPGERTVPLPPMVVNALREWKLACPKGGLDLVFPDSRGRVESHPNIVQRALHPVQIAAGVTDRNGRAKYTGLHALRHFYASWWSGSSSPPSTRRLMHWARAKCRRSRH